MRKAQEPVRGWFFCEWRPFWFQGSKGKDTARLEDLPLSRQPHVKGCKLPTWHRHRHSFWLQPQNPTRKVTFADLGFATASGCHNSVVSLVRLKEKWMATVIIDAGTCHAKQALLERPTAQQSKPAIRGCFKAAPTKWLGLPHSPYKYPKNGGTFKKRHTLSKGARANQGRSQW